MAKLSKERLVAIAERLMSDEPMSPGGADRLCDDFEASTYPQATELIFNWRHKFKNAAEIVDYALGEEEKKADSGRVSGSHAKTDDCGYRERIRI